MVDTKVGQNYTTAKSFEGTNYKKLLSKNIELVDLFNLFSNPFLKIKELDKKTSTIYNKKFSYRFI